MVWETLDAILALRELYQPSEGTIDLLNLHELACSLEHLCDRLRKLKRFAEAVEADKEAVNVWKQLVSRDHNCYSHRLVGSFFNLASDLVQLGNYSMALAANQTLR